MSFWNDDARRERACARYEQRMAIPILAAAALLAAVTLVLIFADISRSARLVLLIVDVALWAFFVLDYMIRLVLAPKKRAFIRKEWIDGLLVVIPLLQPLRLIGAFIRMARLSAAVDRTTVGAERRHKLRLALGWAIALVLIATIVTPIIEPDSSKIKGFGDGAWWALVTTTTVGYGDLVPESATGKVIGAVLMMAGVGIIGLLTANIASIFLEPGLVEGEQTEDDGEHTTEARLAAIDEKLEAILERLDEH